jgi:hypothetical protein
VTWGDRRATGGVSCRDADRLLWPPSGCTRQRLGRRRIWAGFFAVFACSQVRAAGPGRCYGCSKLGGPHGRQATGLAGAGGLLVRLHGAYHVLRQGLLRGRF